MAAVPWTDLIQSLPDSLPRLPPSDIGRLEMVLEDSHSNSSRHASCSIAIRQPVRSTCTLCLRGNPKRPIFGKTETAYGLNQARH